MIQFEKMNKSLARDDNSYAAISVSVACIIWFNQYLRFAVKIHHMLCVHTNFIKEITNSNFNSNNLQNLSGKNK